ncbi:NPXTG-anchored protein [uncultured Ruminococcus sp.]|uniref:NPXTG-anchored protein n=1 Tax=uncultured Ruminococcus sp. TaxID=165186 RepID=UPI0025E3B75D|nr:NPXTG-anchored protein [uncultured Ruminococcus sp.]
MKKTLAMAAAMLISFSAAGMNAYAAENDTQVYVTVADANKNFALAEEPVTVTDIDSDGKLTINDALYIAHENKFEGGASAGYKSSVGQYGLQLDKLWGVENGGSYGYYVNDGMAMGLADEIKNDDQLVAFIYSDTNNYSDSYSFFDAKKGQDTAKGSEVELRLSQIYFDENYAPQSKAVEGAKITINGKATDFVTDADGKVTVKLTEEGMNTVSAASDKVNLVPPIYMVNVDASLTTAATTTTTTTTTTAAETTTTSATTTKAATTKAATTASSSNSPKTGVKGAGITFVGLAAAAAAAFALRRRDEE